VSDDTDNEEEVTIDTDHEDRVLFVKRASWRGQGREMTLYPAGWVQRQGAGGQLGAFLPGDGLQQSGLASAVGPHDRPAFPC